MFRLAYRQTEGLIGSVIGLLGLDLAVPDHSTLCRRAETLEVPRPKPRGDGAGGGAGGGAGRDTGPMHLLVDSTGLKLYGAGEWLVEKHGTKRRRSWRKLHLGVDAKTGWIVAATLTDRDEDDASQVGPLLDQVEDPVASFTADGAYDQESVYADVAERHPGRGRRRSAALDRRAKRHGRDRADAAGPPPATHRREGQDGLAEGLGLQRARPGRGHHRPVQARDRGRAALAYG